MIRDPSYYLEKADYFYEMSNTIDNEIYDEEYDDILIDDTCGNDEYMYIVIDPKESKTTNRKMVPVIRPKYGRYYDPLTKHYFRSEKIFESNEANKPLKITEKEPDIWYPEVKPRFKIIKDMDTGKYYRITKIYDQDGKYNYQYNKLTYCPYKKIGTNYYQPIYKG